MSSATAWSSYRDKLLAAWRSARRLFKHLWLDASDTERMLGAGALGRITERVAGAERAHSGEIRICIEAGLPLRSLWHVRSEQAVPAVTRQRAIAMFAKLGVWDTEHNNGVLIYLLLAEQAIEIVADRGLNARVNPLQWPRLARQLSGAFKAGQHEQGLADAIDVCSALLIQHFAVAPDSASANPNELPDEPVLQ